MYSLFDGGGSPADSGGVVGGGARIGAVACLLNPPHELQHRPRNHHRNFIDYEENRQNDNYQSRKEHQLCNKERDESAVEMVAQEMAQGYTRLLHGSQKAQEFISFDDLKPRILQELHNRSHSHNQNVSTTRNAQLYRHPSQQQPDQQPQTYYDLSTVPEGLCSTVYFGAIDAGIGEQAVSTTGNNGDIGEDVTAPQAPTGVDQPPQMESEGGSTGSTGHNFPHTNCYQHHHHHHHHHQHRSQCQSPSNSQSPSSGHIPLHAQPISSSSSINGIVPTSRKRKVSCREGSEFQDDNGDDARSVRTNDGRKKQNHSEIEKRRRDKMNTYITELSSMVPMCHAMSRKLDKLTVLRIAVQHLKTILGAVTSYTEGHYKPAFLTDQELKMLILQVAEGFVFVVGCDRGRILYVSESVSQTLNYSQSDLLGQSWFDILHPKDVAKVKEQLSSSDLSPRERLIDAKTMLPVRTDVPHDGSKLCSGARRSFFCRMKRKSDGTGCGDPQVKEEADTTSGYRRRKKQQNIDRKYCVIQCTGYLKSWAPAKIGLEEQEGEGDSEACNLSCLVAVGRIQPPLFVTTTARKPHLRTIQFVSRHAMDGKFVFVDQSATLILGFLPQELLGTSMYEYYHHGDIPHLLESHKTALQSQEPVTTQVYRFRCKEANFVHMQSEWKPFKNPWTKDIEYLIAKNSAIFPDTGQVDSSAMKSEGSNVQGNYDYFRESNGGLERLITSHVEVSKIGRQIAEEVLNSQRRGEQSTFGYSPDPSVKPTLRNAEAQITTTMSPNRLLDVITPGISSDNSSGDPTPTLDHLKNTVQMNSIVTDQGVSQDESMMNMIGDTIISESPNMEPTDGNDEAAMAVIMSLLEADAGLGGPVDFSGLPWPLP